MIEYLIRGACRSYADVPKGAQIVVVNGREVFDICEACGKPVLCDAEIVRTQDGVTLHPKCAP